MTTLANAFYLDSKFGVESELPRSGSPLENPYVYDASARELKALADRGLIAIVRERRCQAAGDELIASLTFKRLR
jgi:hypothetical protein